MCHTLIVANVPRRKRLPPTPRAIVAVTLTWQKGVGWKGRQLLRAFVCVCCRCVKHLWAPKRRFYWGSSSYVLSRAHRKNCYKRACIIHHVEVTPLRIRNNHTPRRTKRWTHKSCCCLPSEGYLTNCSVGGVVRGERTVYTKSVILPQKSKTT